MTPAALDAVRRRCEAAPSGPWVLDAYCRCCGMGSENGICPNSMSVVTARGVIIATESKHRNVGKFIAAAREDVPALLAEVERLRALCRRAGADPDAGG